MMINVRIRGVITLLYGASGGWCGEAPYPLSKQNVTKTREGTVMAADPLSVSFLEALGESTWRVQTQKV